mmetsp:Transcript_45793/g.51247  ORF Transcript_45793/g.51247 Transcript_45793/m.51247 type:complete len:88 (-) Transcript_45793:27-290(-)
MEIEQHLVGFVYSVFPLLLFGDSDSFGISCRARSDGAILHTFLGCAVRVIEKSINDTVVCLFEINPTLEKKNEKVDVRVPIHSLSPP